jgi:hypothetical protein
MKFTNKKFFFNPVQIAAVSPADINYEESLSTLRYGKDCVMRMRFESKID